MDGYATHLPVLAAAMQWSAQFDLPILELGCGDYSTPLLRTMSNGRELHIISSDPEWMGKYESLADKATAIPNRDAWQHWQPTGQYSLILLDNEELVVNRIKHIPALLECCEILVMHDWRAGLPINMDALSNHWGVYDRFEPNTMWASNGRGSDGNSFLL